MDLVDTDDEVLSDDESTRSAGSRSNYADWAEYLGGDDDCDDPSDDPSGDYPDDDSTSGSGSSNACADWWAEHLENDDDDDHPNEEERFADDRNGGDADDESSSSSGSSSAGVESVEDDDADDVDNSNNNADIVAALFFDILFGRIDEDSDDGWDSEEERLQEFNFLLEQLSTNEDAHFTNLWLEGYDEFRCILHNRSNSMPRVVTQPSRQSTLISRFGGLTLNQQLILTIFYQLW